MLKRIATSDVKLGMYLHSMEGAWLSHPFWRTRFVLADPADLVALKASAVQAVWIDASRGADVPDPEPAKPSPQRSPPPSLAPAAPIAAPAPAPRPPEARTSIESEFERAAQVLNRSRVAVTAMFNEARLGKAVDTERCLPIVDEVAGSVARNPAAFMSLARLKNKDDYTYMHSVAVCALMVGLARQLGLNEEQTREAGLAGLLHDIGKMAMPLDILNKPGTLTDAEFDVIRSHPERGYEMLKGSDGVTEGALDVALHHHEKMDGTGYPHALAGDKLTLLARMGAVCDVYDAITSSRPYKAAWDPAGSIQRMAQWQGHFDSNVFSAFVRCVGIYPVGTLVRLQSGRLAVVLDQNPAALVSPRVKVFFSTKSNMPIPITTIDLAAQGVTDKIVGREPPENFGFKHLDDLWKPALPGR